MSSTIKQAIQALKSRIADAYTAIVAKGGTLPATQDSANLPAAIESIPSGGGKVVRGTTFYSYTPTIGTNYGITDAGFADIAQYDWSEILSIENMFENASALTTISAINGSPTIINTSIDRAFYSCYRLQNGLIEFLESLNFANPITNCSQAFSQMTLRTSAIDLTNINFSNSCVWNNAFNGTNKVETIIIPSEIGAGGTSFTFQNCTELKNLTIGGIAATGNAQYLKLDTCNKLTHDSLVGILNALAVTSSTLNLPLGATNLAKLSAAEIAIATNKGWTLA